jgi:low temperature requirement protein LtrA
VFVFAVTQVTTLLAADLTWGGFGRGMLALALVWWAWSAYVWAANAQEERSVSLRLALVASMLLIFVCGLAVPHAFGDDAGIFAGTYTCVRLIHLALYADASRRGNAAWSAIAGFGVTVLVGMGLLIAGAVAGGTAQIVLWTVAAVIDYAGPAWLTRERLRGLQRVAVAHFAERYGLAVIICLGESIVSIGVGAGHHGLSASLVVAVLLGALITVELWFIYFDRASDRAEARLAAHRDPVLAAADGYSYLHLPIVAGIIVFAVGAKALVADVGGDLTDAARLTLCGGPALYLAGHAAFLARLSGRFTLAKPLAVLALLAVFVAGIGPAWFLAAQVALILAALCVAETAASPASP